MRQEVRPLGRQSLLAILRRSLFPWVVAGKNEGSSQSYKQPAQLLLMETFSRLEGG